MRAIHCLRYGGPETLTLTEIPTPSPGKGEVLVRIRAAGVNFPDLLVLKGEHYMRPAPPFVPGLEMAGEVATLGEGVAKLREGDRVMAAPPAPGCFAEYIVLPEERVFPAPPGLSFAEAASFIIVFGTAYAALKVQGKARPGETVLISAAAGGVGLAAIDIAKRMKLKAIAAAGSADKLSLALARGAAAGIDYRKEDLRQRVKDLTGGKGYDLFVDMVGGDIFDAALRASARNARILIVGFASGRIPEVKLNYLITKNLSLIGVGFGGDFAHSPQWGRMIVDELAALHAREPFKPEISRCYALEDTARALEDLAQRRVGGKLVIEL